jgi:dTDP-L-rhamnose 4-epimerase
MRILVTGGAGFIGQHVVRQLRDQGHEVRVVDAALPGAHREPPALPDGVDVTWADLADAAVARQAVAGVDAVCHQAAMVGLGVDFRDAPRYVQHNDLATAVLLRALHERAWAGRLVLGSSMVVYGEGRYRCDEHGEVVPAPRRRDQLDAGEFEPPCPTCGGALAWTTIDEQARVDPRNVYAATKLHQEHLCTSYEREHPGTAVLALRYHNVYGPGMPRDTPYAGVASIFRSAVARGRAPEVFEDGGQTRDFVHVTDVARANVLALTSGAEVRSACNVASGEPRTVLDMATALAARAGLVPKVVGGYRLGDVRHVVASPERARTELGFTASVPFAEGMRTFGTDPLR